MECEMCGRSAQLVKAEVEGSILSVCQNCISFGRRIDFSAKVPDKRKITMDVRSVNPNFSKMVRNARVSAVLTVEQLGEKIGEKANVLERVERGMRPTDDLAKKLEKALNIKLFGVEETEVEPRKKKDSSQSLGDIAVIKHRKK